eukprot:snap_masked-scaffold_10-processed-gene-9.30-mRNA-1 protein AED:1.00 eAED:1.00 QI:0/-1/0/0/-1/1/1/0/115
MKTLVWLNKKSVFTKTSEESKCIRRLSPPKTEDQMYFMLMPLHQLVLTNCIGTKGIYDRKTLILILYKQPETDELRAHIYNAIGQIMMYKDSFYQTQLIAKVLYASFTYHLEVKC